MQRQESAGGRRVQVVIADRSQIHSQLLADAVQRDAQIHVVGSVSNSSDLLEVVAKFPIDVAIISPDLDGNPARGFELLREIRQISPSVSSVMLLDCSRRDKVVGAFRAGAKGVFSETDSMESLGKCIHCVYDGQIWANKTDLKFALDALADSPSIRAVDAKGTNLLSKRESEIVQAVAEGLTNAEIANRFGLSGHTIKNHLTRIFDKLGVSSRMELLFLTLSDPGGKVTNSAPGAFPGRNRVSEPVDDSHLDSPMSARSAKSSGD